MAEERYLRPVEVAALLRAMGNALAAELSALPPELALWHPAPGEWCVNEAVGHIIEAERRGFAGRIRRILAADDPDEPGWDQVAVARERNDCARTPADVAAEFAALRAESVVLASGLSDAGGARACEHAAVGRLTVRDLLHEWVHHDRNHVKQIHANVQAYVWPSMGNARRFSEVD